MYWWLYFLLWLTYKFKQILLCSCVFLSALVSIVLTASTFLPTRTTTNCMTSCWRLSRRPVALQSNEEHTDRHTHPIRNLESPTLAWSHCKCGDYYGTNTAGRENEHNHMVTLFLSLTIVFFFFVNPFIFSQLLSPDLEVVMFSPEVFSWLQWIRWN